MTPAALHIAIHDVSKQAWLGGVEYIHNLVRAVRSLPPGQQPRLTLLQSAWTKPGAHASIASLVDIVQAYPAEAESAWVRLKRQARQTSLGKRYRTFAGVLRERAVDVIFPLVRAPEQPLPVPWIGWAWDLQHRYYPEHFPEAERARRDAVFAEMAASAPLIVLSSRAAQADFERFLGGAAERLRVLHFATVPLDEWYSGDVEAVRARHNLPRKYLALPNAFWAHKNHRVAFEAIRQLSKELPDICLVCTGTTDDPRNPDYLRQLLGFIREHSLESQIRILGVLPRIEQIQVLRGAAAMLQPSLFEGWSTVVEDARALGKTIFLSDIPVHREQAPPGAVYVDACASEALAEAVRERWPQLVPGPQAGAEERARKAQADTVCRFAETFVALAAEGARIR
jgi:glycosyltransferase involved in cell wall biosynthesis